MSWKPKVGSGRQFWQWKSRNVGSASFGNAKGRSITNYIYILYSSKIFVVTGWKQNDHCSNRGMRNTVKKILYTYMNTDIGKFTFIFAYLCMNIWKSLNRSLISTHYTELYIIIPAYLLRYLPNFFQKDWIFRIIFTS